MRKINMTLLNILTKNQVERIVEEKLRKEMNDLYHHLDKIRKEIAKLNIKLKPLLEKKV